jgi:heat shock protein HtpX
MAHAFALAPPTFEHVLNADEQMRAASRRLLREYVNGVRMAVVETFKRLPNSMQWLRLADALRARHHIQWQESLQHWDHPMLQQTLTEANARQIRAFCDLILSVDSPYAEFYSEQHSPFAHQTWADGLAELEARSATWEIATDRFYASFYTYAATGWLGLYYAQKEGVDVGRVQGLFDEASTAAAATVPRAPERQPRPARAKPEPRAALSDALVSAAAKLGAELAQRTRAAIEGYQKARDERRALEARVIADRDCFAAERREALRATPATPKATATASATGRLLDGRRMRGSILPTWLMLVGLSWVSLLWGALISAPFGVGLLIAGTALGGIFVVPLWGTVWGFLGMGAARDSTLREMGFKDLDKDHGLHQSLVRYCRALDIPLPRLGTIDARNAFAMGSDVNNATVAIGRPLLNDLDGDEVDAILAHELGHVVSGDMRKMMLMRTFQNATVWFAMFQGMKQFARWVICWAAELAILAFSRKREYWADAAGAALAGKTAMIGALRALDRDPAVSGGEKTHARFMFRGTLSTHPTMAQRIAALESEAYIRKLPRRS